MVVLWDKIARGSWGEIVKPYLSIIVPVYNTEKYLERCIGSILEQRFREYELILVDNGSTDESLIICKMYEAKDSRIRVICKEHGEVMSARRAGFSVSQGEFVSFVDSDDWMEADYYDILMDHTKIEDADIILMSGYREDDGEECHEVQTRLRQGIYHKNEIVRVLVQGGIIPCLWLKIIKSELIKKNIGFISDNVFRGEDLLCSYACLMDAHTVIVQNNYLYHYVQHASSLMRQYREEHRKSLYYFVKDIKKIRKQKKIYFLDFRWNQFIQQELLHLLANECKNSKLWIKRKEIKILKNKYKYLKLSNMMIGKEGMNALKARKKEERIALFLYRFELFWLLNIYMQKKILN